MSDNTGKVVTIEQSFKRSARFAPPRGTTPTPDVQDVAGVVAVPLAPVADSNRIVTLPAAAEIVEIAKKQSAAAKAAADKTSARKEAIDRSAGRLVTLAKVAGIEIVRDLSTGRKLAVVQTGLRRDVRGDDGLRDYLSSLAAANGLVVTGSALADASRALLSLPARDVRVTVRLGVSDDGERVYLDLADDSGMVVELDANGWRTLSTSPVFFSRPPALRSLPMPIAEGKLDEFATLHELDGDNRVLVLAWLVGAMNPVAGCPVLNVTGTAGSGKSTLTLAIIDLLDPQRAALKPIPKDLRGLAISAENSRILAYDNVSTLHAEMADAWCRTVTGGGFQVPSMYQNRSLELFDSMQPIIANGIASSMDRADLGDRAIGIELTARREYRTAQELAREFDAARPSILGALLTAVSVAVRHRHTPQPAAAGFRMADFAAFVLGAADAGALPFTAAEFISAYRRNRRAVAMAAIDADIIAPYIFAMVPKVGDRREFTPTELLRLLTERAAVEQLPPRARGDWPSSPERLGKWLARLAGPARQHGVEINKTRGATRVWVVERVADPDAAEPPKGEK